MKRKKIFTKFVICSLIFCIVVLSCSWSINGVNYTLRYSKNYNYPTIGNYQYIFYDSFPTSPNSLVPTTIGFGLSVINSCGYNLIVPKSDNDFLNACADLNNAEFFLNGLYGPGINELAGTLIDFASAFNTYWSYYYNIDYNRSQNVITENQYQDILSGSYNFIFTYNLAFREILQLNCVGFLNKLIALGCIERYDDVSSDTAFELSPFGIPSFDNVQINTVNEYNFLQSVYSRSPIVTYPISTIFGLRTSIDFIQSAETWSFLPPIISNIVLSFIGVLVGIALVMGIKKFLI